MKLADVRFTYSGNDKVVQLRSDPFDDGRELGYCVLGEGNGGALKLQLDRRLWSEFVCTAPVFFGQLGLSANLVETPSDAFLETVWSLLRAAAAGAALDCELVFDGEGFSAESAMLPQATVHVPQEMLSEMLGAYPEMAWADAPLSDAMELHSFMAEHSGEDGCDPKLGLVVALCAYLRESYVRTHPSDGVE